METNLNIDTLIIPLDTEHLEEYPAEFDHILKMIIHFSGSAGTLVLNKFDGITRYIFITDSRYEIMGEKIVAEMKSRGVTLELQIIKPRESHFVCLEGLSCNRVAVNLKRLSISGLKKLIKLKGVHCIESVTVSESQKIEPSGVFEFFNRMKGGAQNGNSKRVLVDLDIFKTVQRPKQTPFSLETSAALNSISHFDLHFSVRETGNDLICGEIHAHKFSRLFKGEIRNKIIIFSALHEINYLLNIRTLNATDSPHLYCFMIASNSKIELYCNWDATRLLKSSSTDLLIETKKYEDFYGDVEALIENRASDILLSCPNSYLINLLLLNRSGGFLPSNDPTKGAVDTCIEEEVEKIIKKQTTTEVQKMMDKKNLNELKGFVQSGLIHAVSLIKFFVKLETLAAANKQVSEKEVANILNEIFKGEPDFLMNSFDSIVGSGKNGASIHYETSDGLVKWNELLLLDCGIQTKYGTTDISRTLLVDISQIKEEYINDYTLVLRAQINGKMIKGKPATMKYLTQFVPRYFVNQQEKDYKHGTGHGVGFCGCVHEFTEFLEGSVFSVEPGVYIKESYGIRLEDVVTCQLINRESSEEFLSLTPLTFVPYQMNLINKKLLTQYETEYLNSYNAMLRKILTPFLRDAELRYLEKNTKQI